MNRISFLVPLLAAPAAAQEPVPLVLEGDSVPGVGNVVSIQTFAVRDSGEWLVEVDTDNADTDADGAVLEPSGLFLREGGAAPAPPGATVNEFDSFVLTATGDRAYNLTLHGTVGGTSDDSGVYVNGDLVIQEGSVSTAPGYGGVFASFSDVKLESNGVMLLRGFADDPAVAGTSDWFAVLATVDGGGNVLSEEVIAKEGQIPPGQTLVINTIRSGPHAGAVNSHGDVIWCADLDTSSPPNDAVAYLNGTVIAQEGLPSPVPGRNWGDIISPEVDINDAGDWTFKDRLDGDFSSDEIIVKNGAKFRQEGDTLPLPAISSFTFERFGNGAVDLTETGSVLWYGDWDDPDTTRDEGLFLDDELIVQEGVTTVGGILIDDVGDQSENYFVSDSGSYVIFEATLADGREGAFLIQLGLGEIYCIAAPNSVGPGAHISASGSNVVADNDFTLATEGLPGGVPGLYFFGPNQIQVAFGDGFRCVGGQVKRLQPVVFASGSGFAQRTVNLAAPPSAGLILPGTSFNFQHWYRDPMAGGAGFNLSTAVHIDWQ